MSRKCPKCRSKNISGLFQSFWVALDKNGEPEGEWADYESCTELGDGRYCQDCNYDWDSMAVAAEKASE